MRTKPFAGTSLPSLERNLALPDNEYAGLSEPRQVPFLGALGIRRTAAGLELDVGTQHLRTLGIAHGGVLATLLDSVMGLEAARTAPSGHFVVTAQLGVNFVRPAWEGETLVATANVRHSGRLTAVAQGEVRTPAGTLVALGSGTFVFVEHTERSREQGAIDRALEPPGDPS